MRAIRRFAIAAFLGLAAGAAAAPFAYVTNEASDDVSVVDTARNAVVATIRVGASPYGIAVSPSGRRAYVTNRRSVDVTVIDTSTNAVVATVPIGGVPMGVAVDPAGTTVYVANSSQYAVVAIDAVANEAVSVVRLPAQPRAIAVARDGRRLYVTTAAPDGLAIVELESRTILFSEIAGQFYGVAASPDGARVYFAARVVERFGLPPPCGGTPPPDIGRADVPPPCLPPWPVDSEVGYLLILDVEDETFGLVEVDLVPFGIALAPDGSRVYVTSPAAGSVSAVDPVAKRIVARAVIGGAPYGIGATPDGRSVLVVEQATRRVSVLDPGTLSNAAVIPVGASPVAFGAFVGPPTELVATEYFHAGFGHYFVTASANETAALDRGDVGGWTRTGASFLVAPTGAPGIPPVCRFWTGATYAPKSSHFYTALPNECALLRRDPNWTYEGLVFAMMQPDAAVRCAPGLAPLYRFYNRNMSGAPNHRYTTSPAAHAQMLSLGWVAEGYGPAGVIGCVGAP